MGDDKMSAHCAHCDVKLEAILSKLELLDATEKSVKLLEVTVAKLDSRIISLERAQLTMNRDIKELKIA